MTNRVADMTVGELRQLIRETVIGVLRDFMDNTLDLDEGLEFKPEIAEQLREYLEQGKPIEGNSLDDIARELGLDD